MMRKYVSIFYLFILTISLSAQSVNDTLPQPHLVAPSPVKWYTIQEAMQLQEIQKRPIVIDIYTDWCGWCKHMMKTTFINEQVVSFMNNQYYAVRLDAETSDTINYNDKKYTKTGKVNELAKELTNGRLSYPTMVFFDIEGQKQVIPGYQKPATMLSLLVYFSEQINKSAPFDDFDKNFTLSFLNDTTINKDSLTSGKVKWYTPDEAFKLQQEKPKMIYLDIYSDMYVRCRMMGTSTYTNPYIADYLNEHFYPVRFPAASRDTVKVLGQQFINRGSGNFALHDFAGAIMNKQVGFPTVAIWDENMKMVNKVNGYFTPKTLEPILKFFAENAYKNSNWETFRENFKPQIP